MLIAVTSKSGSVVDQHFGHAERFIIFDYAGGNPQQIKEVAVEKYCSDDPNHSFHETRFAAITGQLDGCKALVTEMIGEFPRQELEKAGIKPVISSGWIDAALKLAHDTVCSGACNKKGPKKNCPHH